MKECPPSGSGAPDRYPELFRRHRANPLLTARDWPYPAHTVFNAVPARLEMRRSCWSALRIGAVIRI